MKIIDYMKKNGFVNSKGEPSKAAFARACSHYRTLSKQTLGNRINRGWTVATERYAGDDYYVFENVNKPGSTELHKVRKDG